VVGDYMSNARTLYEIEAGTGVKYLSTILDLDKNDIPMLQKLERDTLNHLAEVYKVCGSADKIKLFFIFLWPK